MTRKVLAVIFDVIEENQKIFFYGFLNSMEITCIHFKLKATVLAMLYQFKVEILLIFITFDTILNLFEAL